MDKLALWDRLERHPLAGWLAPSPPAARRLPEPSRLVWCGIGGSLRPAEALVEALGTPEDQRRWVALVAPGQEAPPLSPFDQLVLASRSGTTLELWSWIAELRARPVWGRWHHPPLVITQDDGNPLVRLAEEEGWPLLPFPARTGGRYSAFTAVGTLPLAWMGRDAEAFVAGGRRAVEEVRVDQGPWGRRVWQAVETLAAAHGRGVRIWAFLPYSERLHALGAWWVQLVAESLGKAAGDGARVGFTPIAAAGPQDQHAQLQRWIAGPRDVGVVLLTVGGGREHPGLRPPPQCPFPGLAGLTPSQVLEAEAEGTHRALVEAGVPVLRWHLDAGLSERDLGALCMAWQLAVALLGLALGVDPFDQPAVEAGKRWTSRLLGLEGGVKAGNHAGAAPGAAR